MLPQPDVTEGATADEVNSSAGLVSNKDKIAAICTIPLRFCFFPAWLRGWTSFQKLRLPYPTPMSCSSCGQLLHKCRSGWHAHGQSVTIPITGGGFPGSRSRQARRRRIGFFAGPAQQLADAEFCFMQLRLGISNRAIQQFGD